jgi:steroid delta-isomerase-like uncharacterized protein
MNDAQHNVDLVRRAFSVFNTGDLDRCMSLLAEDFVINLAGMPFQMRGRAPWRGNVELMQAAFPDIHADIDDIFGDGDRVAVRLTFRGTHRGDFQGIPATGREVAYMSLEHYRIQDGLLAEEWISSDLTTLMRQLTEPEQAH